MADRVEQGLSSMEPNAELNDLVSRQALIAELEELKSPLYGYGDFNYGVESAIHAVENAPAVEAVPVRREHWNYTGEPDGDNNIQAYCSGCGAGDKHATSMKDQVPYCWKCGARMDGGVCND